MSENADKPVTPNDSENEITIFSMDLVAWLRGICEIKEDRDGTTPSLNSKERNVCFWVFKKTPQVDAAISEWNKRQEKATQIVFKFKNEQFVLRNRKAQLERAA